MRKVMAFALFAAVATAAHAQTPGLKTPFPPSRRRRCALQGPSRPRPQRDKGCSHRSGMGREPGRPGTRR